MLKYYLKKIIINLVSKVERKREHKKSQIDWWTRNSFNHSKKKNRVTETLPKIKMETLSKQR